MESWLAGNEVAVRLGVFLSILIVMMTWELAVPHRRLSQPRRDRWTVNLSLVVINSATLRLIFPILAVGTTKSQLSRSATIYMADAHERPVASCIEGPRPGIPELADSCDFGSSVDHYLGVHVVGRKGRSIAWLEL